MIKNDQQLDIVREQLGLAESALDELRSEVRPKNEKMYQLMAESYIDMVLSLRSEIDAYLGISPIPEAADIVIALEGQKVALGKTSAGAVTRFIDTFRRGLQSAAEVLSNAGRSATGRRRARWIETACDLPIVGLAPGSVRILLGQPISECLFSEEESEGFNEALSVLFGAIEWADVEDGPSSINAFTELEAGKKQAILAVVSRLLPPRTGDIEVVAFKRRSTSDQGPQFRSARLTRKSRERVKKEIVTLANDTQYVEVEGVIRSVDLDSQAFTLRERPNGEPDLPCEYGPELEDAVKEYLDLRVVVSGNLVTSSKTQHSKLAADNIELLSGDSEEAASVSN
jgi:hypothetical protein